MRRYRTCQVVSLRGKPSTRRCAGLGGLSRFTFEECARMVSDRRVHAIDLYGRAARRGRWTSTPQWRLRPNPGDAAVRLRRPLIARSLDGRQEISNEREGPARRCRATVAERPQGRCLWIGGISGRVDVIAPYPTLPRNTGVPCLRAPAGPATRLRRRAFSCPARLTAT